MSADGERRRVWRWGLVVWAVTVAGAGALTLWLQASAEPAPPTGWYTSEQNGRDAPAPLISAQVSDPPCPEAERGGPVLCVVATRP
ncbi:hypothetical protein OG410_27710 [Streptomyces sp. NBC_00659]|uniref:hypothetical protein n=1 Tax=unclassified Streptomyces TaxID=2593676 RepID=UPI002DD7E5CC|nr:MULTISPECIES: hypothetical protein [unclassified Streptomyces]WRZ39503.1 hypothetical protein OG915_16525 [Streptomyces sp. NBC_00151]